jgi:hypothetical protein
MFFFVGFHQWLRLNSKRWIDDIICIISCSSKIALFTLYNSLQSAASAVATLAIYLHHMMNILIMMKMMMNGVRIY